MMSLKIKKFSASFSILALLLAVPFPIQVLAQSAQQEQDTSEVQVPGGELLGTILNATTQISQQMQGQRQQQQQMLQMQQMMSSLQPRNIPAKFFPQCPIPQTIPNTPVGICEAPAGQIDPGTFNMMNNIGELGSRYVRYYDEMLTPAQNSRTPTGLRCLEDAKTSVISSMVDRQNALQALIDKINKETQLFRDQNAKFLQEMDDINAELHGGGGTGTNENKSLSFETEFSPECQQIIGRENLSVAGSRSKGLLGIVEGMRPTQENAGDYISNEANLEKNFERLLSKLSDDISKNGVNSVIAEAKGAGGYELRGIFKSPGNSTLTNFNDTIEKKGEILQRKRDVIQNELQGILGGGFELPQTTRNFTKDFSRFIQKSDTFFKKKFVSDCVTGAGSSNLSLNMDQLIRSLEQRSTNSSGTAHINYKTALQNILNQDSHFQDKLGQIRALDQRFDNEITVRYRTSDARSRDATPYEIFQESIAACESEYQMDKTHSSDGGKLTGAGSRKEEIERAKSLMQEYKDGVQDFETKIVEEIDYRVRSCGGQEITADSCSQDGIFDMTSPNFCFKNASQCSRQVQSCNQRAKELVQQREAKLKKAAAQFNQNTQQLVARQEQILNDVKNQVLADAEFLKNYFPGSDYKYPNDLFVKMPELGLRNGEMIRGGGKIDFKDLATNVGKLKNQLASQSNKIEKVLDEYIAHQEKQIDSNRETWKEIARKCRDNARSMAANRATQDATQMQQEQTRRGEVRNFCQKFNSLASTENPTAGCSGPFSPEKLYEDTSKIAVYLDNRVEGAIGSYQALCNQSQNEEKRGAEDEPDKLSLADACEEGLYSLQDEIVSNTLDSIPNDLQSHSDEVKDYLLGKIDKSDLPQDVRDNQALVIKLGVTKKSLDLKMSDAETELQSIIKTKGLPDNMPQEVMDEFKAQIEDSDDHYCVTQAFESAKVAVTETSSTDSLTDFKDKFQKQLEKRDKKYQQSSRSIASSNPQLSQEWSDIGQRIGENCEATANTSRGFLGETAGSDIGGMGIEELIMQGINR
jgi:hypothetical protein